MGRFEFLFNVAEGVFWTTMAFGIAIAAVRHRGERRRLLSAAAAALIPFGISDWIEANTGSWWEPWWLLVLKVSCVAILILVLRKWYRLVQTENSIQAGDR